MSDSHMTKDSVYDLEKVVIVQYKHHHCAFEGSIVHEEFHVPQAHKDPLESTSLHAHTGIRRRIFPAQMLPLLIAKISFAAKLLLFDAILRHEAIQQEVSNQNEASLTLEGFFQGSKQGARYDWPRNWRHTHPGQGRESGVANQWGTPTWHYKTPLMETGSVFDGDRTQSNVART
jgi:hypothetical protein